MLDVITASGLLPAGTDVLPPADTKGIGLEIRYLGEGYLHALDARTGTLLWKATLGGQIAAGPMTYQVDGKQYVAIAAGHSLFVFGLRE